MTTKQPLKALKEAFNNKSFIYLTLGFFVCGWHITLVATHIPVYISDRDYLSGVQLQYYQ